MTDKTDIEALREGLIELLDHVDSYGGKCWLFPEDVRSIISSLDQLEAERQRADELQENFNQAAANTDRMCAKVSLLDEEIAALKAKLANPVVLPSGYTVRSGHPFHEGERNVMIPHKQGDWLSRFDVEHAVHVAGFPFTVKGE